jgi:hypothetical protein
MRPDGTQDHQFQTIIFSHGFTQIIPIFTGVSEILRIISPWTALPTAEGAERRRGYKTFIS